MNQSLPKIYLVRHGATDWARSGRHTGRTDIPLLPEGEEEARALAPRLGSVDPLLVLTSPLQRARRTCELAGYGERMQVEPALTEWDYGAYEGLTTPEIRDQRPDWFLFRDGCPDGEMPEQVGSRVDQVIDVIRCCRGDALIVAHGHLLRVLAARWLDLAAHHAQHLVLSTAALSVLGYEHRIAEPAILLWNDQGHLTTSRARR